MGGRVSIVDRGLASTATSLVLFLLLATTSPARAANPAPPEHDGLPPLQFNIAWSSGPTFGDPAIAASMNTFDVQGLIAPAPWLQLGARYATSVISLPSPDDNFRFSGVQHATALSACASSTVTPPTTAPPS